MVTRAAAVSGSGGDEQPGGSPLQDTTDPDTALNGRFSDRWPVLCGFGKLVILVMQNINRNIAYTDVT